MFRVSRLSSITAQLVRIQVTVLTLILLPLTWLEIRIINSSISEKYQTELQKKTAELIDAVRPFMWDYAQEELVASLRRIHIEDTFAGLLLTDDHGNVLFESKNWPDLPKTDSTIHPIRKNARILGHFAMVPNKQILNTAIRETYTYALLKLVLAFSLIGGLSFIAIQRRLVRRILRLKRDAEKLQRKELSKPFVWGTRDELDHLGGSLENARAELSALFDEQRQRNESLKNKNSELQVQISQKTMEMIHQARLASLGEMAAGIAHEINNPLAIIEGSTYQLSKSLSGNADGQKRTEQIKNSTARISKIIQGLKKFSRTSKNTQMSMHSAKFIISESIQLCDPKIHRHHCKVNFDCKEDSWILADDLELEQVFVNLINNSIDATKTDPSKCWINITLTREDNDAVIQVIDGGNGIPQNIQEKLFNPFFTTKPTGEGTGLGLSIVKGILDSHHAKIGIRNEMKNTCFEIRFSGTSKKGEENAA